MTPEAHERVREVVADAHALFCNLLEGPQPADGAYRVSLVDAKAYRDALGEALSTLESQGADR